MSEAPREASAEPAAAAADLPPIADGLPKRLDPRTIAVERIQGSIATAIVAAISLVGVLILVSSVSLGKLWTAVVLLGWCFGAVGLFALAMMWPPVRYRHVGYTVSPDGIAIRRGVLWRTVTSVPRNRVQHTDVSSGLIERAFELATLVIYTAGTQHASVELSGLAQHTAQTIRDHLIEGGGLDGV